MLLKIMTLNLRLVLDRWAERLPLVVAEIRRVKPNLLAVQELALWEGEDQTGQILAGLNEQVMSPAERMECIPARCTDRPEAIAFFKPAGFSAASETLALKEGGRVALKLKIATAASHFEVVNVHLHHLPAEDESIRLPQLQEVLDWIDDPAILLGDFNAAPGTTTIQRAKQRFTSVYALLHGDEPRVTYPTPLAQVDPLAWPGQCLDYIFFTPGKFKPLQAGLAADQPCETDARLYPSDHFGLMAVFTTTD